MILPIISKGLVAPGRQASRTGRLIGPAAAREPGYTGPCQSASWARIVGDAPLTKFVS